MKKKDRIKELEKIIDGYNRTKSIHQEEFKILLSFIKFELTDQMIDSLKCPQYRSLFLSIIYNVERKLKRTNKKKEKENYV